MRYLQCKKLEIMVPLLYKRVMPLQQFPEKVVLELIKYQDFVMHDPLKMTDAQVDANLQVD